MSENQTSVSQSAAASGVIADLLDQLTELLAQRRHAAVEALLGRHPEHAERLRQLLPAMHLLADVGCAENSPPTAGTSESATSREAGALGDFRILREIGRGGMGVVYEAEQISLDRHVALKVLPFAGVLDERQLQRFKNEARAAAGLHHTNIVPVYAVGSDRGVHYYAMQHIEGQTLAAIIARLAADGNMLAVLKSDQRTPTARNGQFPIGDFNWLQNDPEAVTAIFPAPSQAGRGGGSRDASGPGTESRIEEDSRPYGTEDRSGESNHAPRREDTSPVARGSTANGRVPPEYFRMVAKLGIQAAGALDYAHQQGVVHRDVKPSNLIVDRSGSLWITDFGLARMESEQSLTMSGDVLGTLRYMSPEQALARRPLVDHRTDVYSLGATLYELLTLQAAFPETDRRELLRQIADEDPRKPRSLNKSIPAELETIVLKAMEKEPGSRYSTAQDLADDLQRFLEHKPITARPPTFAERAIKWARRHVVGVTAALVVFVVCSLVLAASTIWVSHARDVAHNNEIAALNAEAEKSRQAEKAKTNLQNAVETVTRLLTNVSQEDLFAAPGGTQLRRKLLEDAARQLETLCQNQNDPKLLFQAAWAFGELGAIRCDLGEFKPSLPTFDRALELLAASQASANPGDVSVEYQAKGALIHLCQGNAFWSVGRNDDADVAIEKALSFARAARDRDPTFANIRLLGAVLGARARNRMHQQRFDDALADLQEASKLMRERQDRPDSGTHLWELRLNECEEAFAAGLVHKFRGDSAEAIALFQKAIAMADEIDAAYSNPTRGAASLQASSDRGLYAVPLSRQIPYAQAIIHSQLGLVYTEAAEYEAAQPLFQRAVELLQPLATEFPDLVYTRGELNSATGMLKHVSNPDRPELYWERKIRAWRKLADEEKNPARSRRIVWEIANSEYWRHLGKDALEIARFALSRDPSGEAWTTLGAALYRVQQFPEAVDALLKSDELLSGPDNSNRPELAFNGFFLAMAYWQLGEQDRARERFEKSVEWMQRNQPENPEVVHLRNEAAGVVDSPLARSYRGELFNEKVARYRRAIDRDPANNSAHSDLADFLNTNGDRDGAIAEYRRAIELSRDDDTFTVTRLGNILLEKGEADEAIDLYRRALKSIPTLVEPRHNLVLAFLQKGDFGLALSEWRAALELDADFEANVARVRKMLGLNPVVIINTTQIERLAAFEKRLDGITAAAEGPMPANQRLELAMFAQRFKKQYATAAALYRDAIAEDAGLAADPRAGHRYNAACAAALAAAAKGKDARTTADDEAAAWRQQALDWLRADLGALGELAEKPEGMPFVAKMLAHWRKDPDLDGVRDGEALGRLPEAERRNWEALWADVQRLLDGSR